MEYLPGQGLHREIAGAPLEIAVVLDYAIQMASALSHAHDRGILHRDIKSSKVLVAPDRTVKLVDFGLARVLGPEPGTELTATAACVGPLRYSAPELLDSQTVDQA
jgi:eukaryotic-like serine/threonine-protein kinase